MKILMYGWEFPPIQSGGLGVACKGIVEGLLGHQHEVFLILPKTTPAMQMASGSFKIFSASESGGGVEVTAISTGLYSPYATSEVGYQNHLKEILMKEEPQAIYGKNMMEEVHRYASQASFHAKTVPHEVIHMHDWLTAEAGVQAKKISGQPLVMHVHATEFDRSGENPNQQVYDLEKRGMEHSDRVIAVSQYTKEMLQKYYGVPEWKIDVVHNALSDHPLYAKGQPLEKKDKIVLFLGRMTMQKGPDYFLQMAKRVLSHMPNVKFVMAGDGDMMERVIQLSIQLGIERNVLFSGFLKGEDIAQAYSRADLYVMPSVSEPFGITPLEAIRQGTPVLISKQSGVSEAIKSALRVDFWDVEEMTEKVIAALSYPALTQVLQEGGQRELENMSWGKQAGQIVDTYKKAVEARLIAPLRQS